MTNPTPEQIERICVLCAEYVAEDIRTRVWRLAAQGLAKQRDELQSRLDAAEKALAQARAEGSERYSRRHADSLRCSSERARIQSQRSYGRGVRRVRRRTAYREPVLAVRATDE
jgi:hypothetical protein